MIERQALTPIGPYKCNGMEETCRPHRLMSAHWLIEVKRTQRGRSSAIDRSVCLAYRELLQ